MSILQTLIRSISPAHPSREGSLQCMQREPVAAPLLREPDAPVGESERSYSAGRGGIQVEPSVPREPVAAPPLREPEAPHQQANHNFPTDSKGREKQKDAENKEKGIDKVVKKKPKFVEKHYDDCGDDLRGLCAFSTLQRLSMRRRLFIFIRRGEWDSNPTA